MSRFTQFSERGFDECEVVIGFDYGTSCSKVVIRTPYQFGDQSFAVSFGSYGHNDSRYLLPSILWLGLEGSLSLNKKPNSCLLRDIKYHLAKKGEPIKDDDGREFDSKIISIAYIALALRECRKWFLSEKQAIYGKFTLRWSFNVGMPSADYNDEDLCSDYDKVSNAAWWLSVSDSPITLATAEQALTSPDLWDQLGEDDDAEIKCIPEVAAEVAGYAKSDSRNDGLHILVDIGASTLDICSFILHEQAGDDRYEILTADVQMLGAMILYQERVEGVREAVEQHVSNLWDHYDPVSPMPDELKQYEPCPDRIHNSVTAKNIKYSNLCKRRFWATIMALKTNRDPNSDRWTSYLPIFVSGGGSTMKFYKDAVQQLHEQLSELYKDCLGIQMLALEKPENFEADVNETVFHRLAVAWGLSYPETDIGTPTRPDDIENVAGKEVINPYAGFISKDMV